MWSPLLALLLAGLSVVSGRAPFGCKPCQGVACGLRPSGCLYGIVRDPCDRWICASGPGGTCGGSYSVLGKCGSGLSCNPCGRCTGCSKELLIKGTRDCFRDTC